MKIKIIPENNNLTNIPIFHTKEEIQNALKLHKHGKIVVDPKYWDVSRVTDMS